MLYASIFFFSLTGIFLLTICCICNKIRLAVQVVKVKIALHLLMIVKSFFSYFQLGICSLHDWEPACDARSYFQLRREHCFLRWMVHHRSVHHFMRWCLQRSKICYISILILTSFGEHNSKKRQEHFPSDRCKSRQILKSWDGLTCSDCSGTNRSSLRASKWWSSVQWLSGISKFLKMKIRTRPWVRSCSLAITWALLRLAPLFSVCLLSSSSSFRY